MLLLYFGAISDESSKSCSDKERTMWECPVLIGNFEIQTEPLTLAKIVKCGNKYKPVMCMYYVYGNNLKTIIWDEMKVIHIKKVHFRS